ncbi:cell division protein ZapA [Desulfobacterales bacterium HSG2]|nr:cell division protein ZapA [Desulfobacterales bacterium HSG2]
MEQLVNIELFGQSYTFKTESELSEAREAANLLVKEVAKIELQLSAKSPVPEQTILILAALNIAGENYKLKRKYSDMVQEITERSASLIHTLDIAS